jgi:hypothetical protein
MRRISEAAKRAAERRERENAANRLHDLVPELEGLTINIDERRPGERESEVRHIRHIVISQAPALFDLPCCDRQCDGHHDLTRKILSALRAHKTQIEGHDRCVGQSRNGDCGLELHFVAEASYAA